VEPLETFFSQENISRGTWPHWVYVLESDLPPMENTLLTQPLLTLAIAAYYQRTPKILAPLQIQEDEQKQNFYRAVIIAVDQNATRDDALLAVVHHEALFVALGLININFSALSPAMIEEVRKGQIPFGALLIKNHIKTRSVNIRYFKIVCDAHLATILKCQPGDIRYGRSNTLMQEDNLTLAQVVEILAAKG
jgi:hypothetical protein